VVYETDLIKKYNYYLLPTRSANSWNFACKTVRVFPDPTLNFGFWFIKIDNFIEKLFDFKNAHQFNFKVEPIVLFED
jgi:hypothetical protein